MKVIVQHCLQERLKAPFSPEMEKEVSDFLFNHYRVHFNSRTSMAWAFACIPQVQCSPYVVLPKELCRSYSTIYSAAVRSVVAPLHTPDAR